MEETTKGPPLEILERAWPSKHLDFILLASRTAREYAKIIIIIIIIIIINIMSCSMQEQY